MKTLKLISALFMLAIVCVGCSVTKYGKFFNASLGNNRSIAKASLTPSTNGVPTFYIEGYQSDQAQAAGAMAEGLSRGFAAYLTGGAVQPAATVPTVAKNATVPVAGNPVTPVRAKNAQTENFEGRDYILVQEPDEFGRGLYVWEGPDGQFYTRTDGKMILLP